MVRKTVDGTLVDNGLANLHAWTSEVHGFLFFCAELCDYILCWDDRHDVDWTRITLLLEEYVGRSMMELGVLHRHMANEAFMNVFRASTSTDVRQTTDRRDKIVA